MSLAANRLAKEEKEKDPSPDKSDVIDDPLRGADGGLSPLKDDGDTQLRIETGWS